MLGAVEDDCRRAGPLEQLPTQRRRKLLAAWLGERQDRQFSGLDVVVEQFAVIAPDRWNKNQHLSDHHKNNGQQQQSTRKTMGDKPIGPGKSGAQTAKHGAIKPQEALK